MWLAVAYAVRAFAPVASTLPSAAALVAFHGVSAVWYAARYDQIALAKSRSIKWHPKTTAERLLPQLTGSCAETVMCAASSVLQFPLSCPCAAAFPFVAFCLLGMESAVGGNVMLLLQSLLIAVAVVFDGALLLPLFSTSISLAGFAVLGPRASVLSFRLTAVGHAILATLAAIVFVQQTRQRYDAADALTAAFAAVMCAEARIRAATNAVDTRKIAIWACRVASAGCVVTLPLRAMAENIASAPHVATIALGAVALLSPWNWNAHSAWNARRADPPKLAPSDISGLGVAFVVLMLASHACSHYVAYL